jgi:hypothetical protein
MRPQLVEGRSRRDRPLVAVVLDDPVIVEFVEVALVEGDVDPLALVVRDVLDRPVALPRRNLFGQVADAHRSVERREVPHDRASTAVLQEVEDVVSFKRRARRGLPAVRRQGFVVGLLGRHVRLYQISGIKLGSSLHAVSPRFGQFVTVQYVD